MTMITIFVSHASQFDYRNQLYLPLQQSFLKDLAIFILPHESLTDTGNTKLSIKKADIVLAETSYASTGSGIEIGWAESFEKPIIAIHRETHTPSSSIKDVAVEIISYKPSDFNEALKKSVTLRKAIGR
jgi:hypothetical protein